jgi:collagenase-like PrtC family protease
MSNYRFCSGTGIENGCEAVYTEEKSIAKSRDVTIIVAHGHTFTKVSMRIYLSQHTLKVDRNCMNPFERISTMNCKREVENLCQYGW